MKIRKLIINGEEQYVHSLPVITRQDAIPEDVQDGEIFLTMIDWDVALLVFKGGTWRYTILTAMGDSEWGDAR